MGLLSRTRAIGRWTPPEPSTTGGLLTYPRTYPPTPHTVPEYNAYRRAYNRGSGVVFTARLFDDLCYRIERLEARPC